MKKILNICLAILICSCGKVKKDKFNLENIKTYEINKHGDDFFQWNELVNKIDIIPLETTDNSLIGYLTKCIIKNRQIYILDLRLQSLFVFEESGKFIKKIGNKGRGPGEYIEIKDFCVMNSNVYVLDYKRIHCFDGKTGLYQETLAWHSDKEFNPSQFILYHKDHYFLWCSNPDVWDSSRGKYYRMQEMKKSKPNMEYFKFEYQSSDGNRFYSRNDSSYYIKPLDGEDVIYQLSKDSIFASFMIDFREHALSSKQIDELRKRKEPNAYLKSNYFKNISDIWETKKYIYFRCVGPDAKSYEGLINKETEEVKFGRWDYMKSPRFFFSDGIYLYGYYEPSTILNRRDYSSRRNSCFNVVFEQLSNIDISDNILLAKICLK